MSKNEDRQQHTPQPHAVTRAAIYPTRCHRETGKSRRGLISDDPTRLHHRPPVELRREISDLQLRPRPKRTAAELPHRQTIHMS
ncbi:unnamed protein product [Brassica oleracea]